MATKIGRYVVAESPRIPDPPRTHHVLASRRYPIRATPFLVLTDAPLHSSDSINYMVDMTINETMEVLTDIGINRQNARDIAFALASETRE